MDEREPNTNPKAQPIVEKTDNGQKEDIGPDNDYTVETADEYLRLLRTESRHYFQQEIFLKPPCDLSPEEVRWLREELRDNHKHCDRLMWLLACVRLGIHTLIKTVGWPNGSKGPAWIRQCFPKDIYDGEWENRLNGRYPQH